MREAFVTSVVDESKRIHGVEYGGRWYARTPRTSHVCAFWRTPRGDWAYMALVSCPDGLVGWTTPYTLDQVDDIRTCAQFLENQDRYYRATEL